jgi:hypothetical protein
MTPIITLSCLIDGWALAAESGFPTPLGLDGLIATLLVTRASMALRAPVLFVRLRSATRSGRFGRAPRAGCRRCIRRDIVGSRGGASCSPPPRRSVFLRYGRPTGDGQRYEPTERVGQESARSGAIGSMQGLGLPVRSFVRPIATTLPTVPDGTSVRSPVSVHGHPSVALEMMPARQRRGTAGEPAQHQLGCEVFDVPLSVVAGCLQDDVPVRRSSRLRTTSGGARCVYFETASTSTPCSLTVAGPARTSPRPCVSPVMRAPLTLRRFPGAFSFQQQPTREESP